MRGSWIDAYSNRSRRNHFRLHALPFILAYRGEFARFIEINERVSINAPDTRAPCCAQPLRLVTLTNKTGVGESVVRSTIATFSPFDNLISN